MELKRWTVGLLAGAALAWSGCGVGVDDPEAQAATGAATPTQQALGGQTLSPTKDPIPSPADPNAPPLVDINKLPQDPVPIVVLPPNVTRALGH